ncbi:MAG TPA: hypothetical protein VF867_18645 [Arthrobacter sp.]
MSTTTERPQKAARVPKPPKEPKAAREPKAPKIRVEKAPKAVDAAPAEAAWPSAIRPSAVLLPAKVAGRRLYQRAVKRSMVALGAAVAILAVIYIPVAAGSASAQANLDDAQSAEATHRSYLAANAPVKDYFDGFVTRRQAVAEALVKDVSFSSVVLAIKDANRSGVTFSEIRASPKTAKTTTGDLFAPSTAIGYLTLSGIAPSEAGVMELIGSLAESKGLLTDPYLTVSGATRGGTSFTISVGYTEKAFTFKGEPFRPSDEELASAAASAAAAAIPAATTPDVKDAIK